MSTNEEETRKKLEAFFEEMSDSLTTEIITVMDNMADKAELLDICLNDVAWVLGCVSVSCLFDYIKEEDQKDSLSEQQIKSLEEIKSILIESIDHQIKYLKGELKEEIKGITIDEAIDKKYTLH